MTEEDKCPVSPTCQEFALYLNEQGYRGRFAEYTYEFFEAREFEWALKHKDESTANLNHNLALNFLDTMLRRAAKDVPILHYAMERFAVMDIKILNLTMAQYYKTLDDYTKMEVGIAFGLMQIAVKQTPRDSYRNWKELLVLWRKKVVLQHNNCRNIFFFQACYELYPEKLEKATQGWVFDANMDFPSVRVNIEKILSNDNIDINFLR
jgi:hypothetical protein